MQTTRSTDIAKIRESIRDFINQTIDISDMDDDVNLFESGIVNSLFAVQLMTFLERTFNFEVTMDDLDIQNFHSITATAAFVQRKVGPSEDADGCPTS